MSPYATLKAKYALHPKPEPFLYWVDWYHEHGFVFSRPDFFCMGRPVLRHAPEEMIIDDRELFRGITCDCWYVMAAAGNMARMWSVQPWELPWFCWTRVWDPTGALTFTEAARLKERCPPDLRAV